MQKVNLSWLLKLFMLNAYVVVLVDDRKFVRNEVHVRSRSPDCMVSCSTD